MAIIPFVCLGIGIVLGIFVKSAKFVALSDKVSTFALIFLMLSIGLGIGLDQGIISNLGRIGFNCAVIALCAIGFSVLFTYLCEKTVLPLKVIDDELKARNLDLYTTEIKNEVQSEKSAEGASGSSSEKSENAAKIEGAKAEKKEDGTNLVWIMPGSLVLGLVGGIFSRSILTGAVVDKVFIVFLIILYICVGISQGANKEVFLYVRVLGLKILWLPGAILCGSIVGGIIAGLVLQLPFNISLISASGMSFYSITGAFMTSAYGLEVGTYGFIVNVMREFFTILMMPLLIKISPGSPIAGGAAGNMDTMLAPVTKFVGVRLGLVTLITGTVLTFLVPFLLPLLSSII